MKPFEKSIAAVKRLAARTSWPDGVTPVVADSASDNAFWPAGFTLSGINAGIKPVRKDLMLMLCDEPASTASVFTTNRCCAAPVELSKAALSASGGKMRAVICNSGNANAATGASGMENARLMAETTAAEFGLDAGEVLVASTGVIGQQLPVGKIAAAMPSLKAASGATHWRDAAEAIMTTDTFPKAFGVDVALSGGVARIAGIAKGSGMICPNMATMLAFLGTDVSIEPSLLQELLGTANAVSFNAITVDGDTSTNDMASIMASGKGPEVLRGSDDARLFGEALRSVMTMLAQLIIVDGEGATKFVELRVTGAKSDAEARMAAMTVANSPLVKTAIHGEDANWGRIIAAAGRSGASFTQEELSVHFDDEPILKPGLNANFSEERAKEVMSKDEFTITLSLGKGSGRATVWTCDLSHGYIEINGSYRS
ncbi:bifunctional glutamate N-acetyltransferase/amino-acid acetyltransferase ArgJ [Chlorobaculum sp. MV4-Y]|uniref:bifunctional glutamate N-acetyltransferase/amino-acid acetyltransferase ArgJ n=1 Tax=Chlorobaculum sp. MV4-Y TaxID=2976335 RepID=UPI0039833D63